jgi:hypothetical protein
LAELKVDPHNQFITGDPSYSPPEFLYHSIHSDWNVRRQACDLFHLGSLLTFYYCKSPMTALLKSYLPSPYNWQNWAGEYKKVLPYLNEAFEAILMDLYKTVQSSVNDEKLAKEIIEIIKQLCAPDPEKRGHPSNFGISATKYSLERYIAWFMKLARIFETRLI